MSSNEASPMVAHGGLPPKPRFSFFGGRNVVSAGGIAIARYSRLGHGRSPGEGYTWGVVGTAVSGKPVYGWVPPSVSTATQPISLASTSHPLPPVPTTVVATSKVVRGSSAPVRMFTSGIVAKPLKGGARSLSNLDLSPAALARVRRWLV